VLRLDSEEGDASGGGKGGGGKGGGGGGGKGGGKGSSGSSEARALAFGEEERRLAYVALSRPQATLVVSYVLQVTWRRARFLVSFFGGGMRPVERLTHDG
jgi:hypothetical protein